MVHTEYILNYLFARIYFSLLILSLYLATKVLFVVNLLINTANFLHTSPNIVMNQHRVYTEINYPDYGFLENPYPPKVHEIHYLIFTPLISLELFNVFI